jgi:Flp pilus assembly protein TadG
MSRVRADGGSMTLWLLGLAVVLLFLGGLSLDLWRGYSERRALANLADAAALAGTAAIDEEHFRATGEVRLDPAGAERRAADHAARQAPPPALTGVSVEADTSAVRVTATGTVPLTLLRLLAPAEPWTVTVRAVAVPQPQP